MSNAHPADYHDTDVDVSTAAHAHVKTTAHYKTTDTSHHAKANAAGKATVVYDVGSATPGYKVKVDVHVKHGGRVGNCSTHFTPKSD